MLEGCVGDIVSDRQKFGDGQAKQLLYLNKLLGLEYLKVNFEDSSNEIKRLQECNTGFSRECPGGVPFHREYAGSRLAR